MADVPQKPATDYESFSSAGSEAASDRNWTPMIVGAGLVIVAITLMVVFTRDKPVSSQPDPYVAKIQISNLHMETAQNFAGGSVTYIEGTLANTGDRKVTGVSARAIFRNSLGELVGDPILPVMVLLSNAPVVDYGPADRAPIGPGRSRDFRITLEHISTDWNGEMPQVNVVAVTGSS